MCILSYKARVVWVLASCFFLQLLITSSMLSRNAMRMVVIFCNLTYILFVLSIPNSTSTISTTSVRKKFQGPVCPFLERKEGCWVPFRFLVRLIIRCAGNIPLYNAKMFFNHKQQIFFLFSFFFSLQKGMIRQSSEVFLTFNGILTFSSAC